ncbi:MAG: hypothetical protein CMI73_03355 [Candidatus Pelagibacter sp.]|nr:hypothetical protein [Candidatus Pelagibacter sp.]
MHLKNLEIGKKIMASNAANILLFLCIFFSFLSNLFFYKKKYSLSIYSYNLSSIFVTFSFLLLIFFFILPILVFQLFMKILIP